MTDNYTYNSADNPGYYTGDLSATSIVDQKDTYMAFVQNSGRSEPEIIQANKYRILTLIDENGEVYTPSDEDVISSSIIKNVFGRGKRIQVRVVSNAEQANLNFPTFYGTHTSMGVGFFQNILVTTYGTGAGDFIQTMSFANAQPQNFIVEDLSAKWGTNLNFNTSNTVLPVSTWVSASYMFSNGSTNTNFTTTGPIPNSGQYKLENYSTSTAGTSFRVKVRMQFSIWGNRYGMQWRVRNLTTDTVLWTSPTFVFNTTLNGVNLNQLFGFENGSENLEYVMSDYLDMNQNDEFQIEWKAEIAQTSNVNGAKIQWAKKSSANDTFYETWPFSPASSQIGVINYINGVNAWYAPYIETVYTFTGSIQGFSPNSSLLVLSPTGSGTFNNYPQKLDPLSEAFNFGGVEVLPFNQIRAGDFIRFGYWNFNDPVNPTPNIYLRFIERVSTFNDKLGLYITPQLVSTGSQLGPNPVLIGTGSQYDFPSGSINNFNIYRIDENNDTAIVNLFIENMYPVKGPFNYLNPTTNASPTMILFPENASQKLIDNYNSIIKRLTAEGVIY